MGNDDAALARRLWQHYEPVHAVVYFAPEVADEFASTGLKGWWSGYFAGRGAPLGECPPEVIEAVFFGFAPALVHRSLPYAWSVLTPTEAVDIRERTARAVLDRLLGPGEWMTHLERTAALLRLAVDGAELAGRALFAGNRALAWPEDPLTQVWHGCTLLREHRGDGHNAALVAAGVDGLRANLLAVGANVLKGSDAQRAARGWSETEWSEAADDLVERSWLDDRVSLTPVGTGQRDEIESATDRLALGPLRALGGRVDELIDLLAPLVAAVVTSGTIAYPNPIGLTPPAHH
ncbi:hypothetical protein BH10ACT3_BH10ACT3_24480 [soil metagenome]